MAKKKSKYELQADAREERFKLYRKIPQGDWRELTGRDTAILRQWQTKFELPMGGRTFNLEEFAPAFIAFLTKHRRAILKPPPDERAPTEMEKAELKLKQERALKAEMERLKLEGVLMERAQVHAWLARSAEYLRRGNERLQREFGEKAFRIIKESLDELEADIRKFVEEQEKYSGGHDSPDVPTDCRGN